MKKLITLIWVLLLFHTSCKKPDSSLEKMTAMVVFQKGKSFIGQKEIKLGDKVQEGELISVPPRSTLEIQIIIPASEILIKLKENS